MAKGPLAVFRRHQKWMIGVFGVVLMVVFTLTIGGPDLSDLMFAFFGTGRQGNNPVVVTWKNGSIRETEMSQRRFQHALVVNYLGILLDTALARGATTEIEGATRENPGIPGSDAEELIVQNMLLADKAQQMGIVISDEAVFDFLDKLVGGAIDRAEMGRIFAERFGRRMSHDQLMRVLKNELLARRMRIMAFSGLTGLPPSAAWEYFSRLRQAVEAQIVPLQVESFIAQAPEPTPRELQAFYDEHKFQTADPDLGRIGFKRRYRAKFQYFLADYDAFFDRALAQVTDAEIEQYYQDNLNSFRVRSEPSSDDLQLDPDFPLMDFDGPEFPSDDGSAEPALPDGLDAEGVPNLDSTDDGAVPPVTPGDPGAMEEEDLGGAEEANGAAGEASDEDAGLIEEPANGSSSSEMDHGAAPPSTSNDEVGAEDQVDRPAVEDGATGAADAGANRRLTVQAWPIRLQDQAEDDAAEEAEATDSPVVDDLPVLESPIAEEPPAGPSPTEEIHAVETPLQETPAEEAAAAEPMAEEAAGDETAPVAADQADGPAPETPEPEYRPLEEVKDRIRQTLAARAAQQAMEEAIGRVQPVLDRFHREHLQWEALRADEPDRKAPLLPDFAALAKENGLVFGETPLVDRLAVRRFDIGKAQRIGWTQGVDASGRFTPRQTVQTFSDIAFVEAYPEYKPQLFPGWDSFGANQQFLFWKVEESAAHTPSLSEIREEVAYEWKRQRAFELGMEKARAIARQLEQGRTIEEAAAGLPILQSGEFSYYEPEGLELLDGVENIGEEFMRAVFEPSLNEVAVAHNASRTQVYVVRVTKTKYTEQQLRDQFVEGIVGGRAPGVPVSLPPAVSYVAQFERSRMFGAYLRQLEEEMKLQWQREPIVGTQADF